MAPISQRESAFKPRVDEPRAWTAITSGDLSAEIDPLGSQLSVLRDRDGRDLLWDGNPAVWTGRAPLLFPIVGALADGMYRLDGTTYALPRHGFARGKVFERVESTGASACFRLREDDSTLVHYPFRFELSVVFTLARSTLSITTTVKNLGNESMPASFGYHPAFRWPLVVGSTRSGYFIEFAEAEPAPVRRLNSAGLLTAERHPTPLVERRLYLDDALFEADVIIFDALGSRSVIYGAANGPRLRITYPDSPYLGVWSKPAAGFVCIEPWHGVADPVGFTGDFRDKPGVFSMVPGGERTIVMTIEVLDC